MLGHVVHVARPADAVTDRFAANEVRGLESAQLLEHAGPARTEVRGEVIRWARPVATEADEQLAAERGRALHGGRTGAGGESRWRAAAGAESCSSDI